MSTIKVGSTARILVDGRTSNHFNGKIGEVIKLTEDLAIVRVGVAKWIGPIEHIELVEGDNDEVDEG